MLTHRRRLSTSLVVVPLALALAACGSSESGSGSRGSTSATAAGPGSSTPSTSPTSSSSSPSSSVASSSGTSGTTTTDAVELVARMRAATATVTSAAFTTTTSFSGTNISGSGVQKLSRGKLVAFDVTQKLPGGEQRIIIVNGRTYLKQPGISTDPAKPYVLVTASSTNPLIRQLASSLSAAQSSASIDAAVGFLTAAKSVSDKGAATVAGQPTRHYTVVVDPSKLPASTPNSAEIQKANLPDLPIDLYLDSQGRPVQTVTKFTVQGRTISSTFLIRKYNGAVTVQAPPASQVTTR